MNFAQVIAELQADPSTRIRRKGWPSGFALRLTVRQGEVLLRYFEIECAHLAFHTPYRITDADVSARDWSFA